MSDHRTHDLLGHPLAPAGQFRKDGRLRKLGYAARPGTGPKGQRCNTCSYCIVIQQGSTTVRKCQVTVRLWTPGPETNIKHNAPACSEWARKPFNRIIPVNESH